MLETIVLRVGTVSLTCSAVLLPLFLLTQWLHNRYTARTRYFLWLLLALRLVLPFQLTLPTPAVTVEAPSPAITIPNSWNMITHMAPNSPQTQPSPPSAAGPADPPAAPEAPAALTRTISLMEILGAVWLAGAAVYAGFYLLTYAAGRHRLLSRAAPAEEAETVWLQRLTKKTGCRRAARLYWSVDVQSPMMLGLVRPVILLPDRTIGEEELTIVLQHELTHLKRGDIAYKLLLLAANCLHWFNPLVWWMAREAAHNLELCCDDDVVRHRDEDFRRLYGEILLRTAQVPDPVPALSTRFGSGKAQMKERLLNMFRPKRNSALLVCLVFLTALLTGSLVACESGMFTLTGEEPLKSEQIQPRSGTVKVRGDCDTDVVFTDTETGETYKIGYITSGVSEKIKLPKGKWYTVAGGGNLTVGPVNVRVEEKKEDPTASPSSGEDTSNMTSSAQPEKDLLYIDLERGFTLQFPTEWANLVEIKAETEDASLLTLYHSAGRKEDDPTAGVLGNLCVDTMEDFNGLYGDKDLDGIYEYGGPRIWVLGTVGEYLIHLHIDPLPDGGTWDTEFARLHQQLEQSPCMTFIAFRQDEQQAAGISKEQLTLSNENANSGYLPTEEKSDGVQPRSDDTYEPEPAARKRLSEQEIAALAEKYDPHNMTQDQYDAFLDELVEKNVLTRSDTTWLWRGGLRRIDVDLETLFTEGGAPGPTSIVSLGNSGDDTKQLLEETENDLLTWLESMLTRQSQEIGGSPQKSEALNALYDVVKWM